MRAALYQTYTVQGIVHIGVLSELCGIRRYVSPIAQKIKPLVDEVQNDGVMALELFKGAYEGLVEIPLYHSPLPLARNRAIWIDLAQRQWETFFHERAAKRRSRCIEFHIRKLGARFDIKGVSGNAAPDD